MTILPFVSDEKFGAMQMVAWGCHFQSKYCTGKVLI